MSDKMQKAYARTTLLCAEGVSRTSPEQAMYRFNAHRIFDILLDLDFRARTREERLAFIGEKLHMAVEAEHFHMARCQRRRRSGQAASPFSANISRGSRTR